MKKLELGATLEEVHEWVSGRDWRLLIDGAMVSAESGDRFDVISPLTGSAVAHLPDAGALDAHLAVEAARAASEGWRRTPVRERAQLLRKLADIARHNADELAILDAIDVGNTVTWMKRDVLNGADGLDLMADLALSLGGSTIPLDPGFLHFTEREPVGVVARIVAFNHPAMFALQKIAAPLAAGNPVILKPSDMSSLSALRMGELFAEALPPGTLSVLTGKGSDLPRALVRHPDIRRIGFIGSETTGRAIQRDAAEVAVKDITLELGGKNAIIVFPDVDVHAAAAAVVKGMNFQGWQSQSCSSTSRVYAHEAIADALLAEVASLSRRVVIGDPLDPDTEMGPMASQGQHDKASEYVRIALDEGCIRVTGHDATSADGLYFPPTIMDGVRSDMRIAREEVFGPVLSVIRWGDESRMIREVNDLSYGLTAAVICRDISTAHRTARSIDAGYVWINDSATHYAGVPFGGYKSSGLGREESVEELLSYTQLKAVSVRLAEREDRVWEPSD